MFVLWMGGAFNRYGCKSPCVKGPAPGKDLKMTSGTSDKAAANGTSSTADSYA